MAKPMERFGKTHSSSNNGVDKTNKQTIKKAEENIWRQKYRICWF